MTQRARGERADRATPVTPRSPGRATMTVWLLVAVVLGTATALAPGASAASNSTSDAAASTGTVDEATIEAMAPLGLPIDPEVATALVDVAADDVAVDIGDHSYMVLLDGPRSIPDHAGHRETRASLGGYHLALPGLGIDSGYTVRMVHDHPQWHQASTEVSKVRAELAKVTGATFAAGTSVPGHTFATGEITVQVGTSSPCGSMSNPGIVGCGGFVASPDRRILTGQVYLCTCMLASPELHELVLHETAHAVGVGHYDAFYEGQRQVMASVGPVDASFYRSGDVNGLRKVTANGFGGGTAPNHPPSATSTPSVSGSFARLHASWSAASAYGRTIDAHQIQAQHTGSGATKTVLVGGSRSGSVDVVGGASYRARVRARNALGWGPWSPWSGATYVTGRCLATMSDVAENATFCPEITWLVAQDVASGFSDGTFRPGTSVSRQAMAAFLRRNAERLVPDSTVGGGSGSGFSDVGPTHPFADDVAWLAGAGIATGFPDGTFRPTQPISRQAMAAMVQRFSHWLDPDLPAPGGSSTPFADVAADDPFATEIAWLWATGLSSGFPDGTYRPDDVITRQAMAALLFRHDDIFG